MLTDRCRLRGSGVEASRKSAQMVVIPSVLTPLRGTLNQNAQMSTHNLFVLCEGRRWSFEWAARAARARVPESRGEGE